MPTQRGRKSAAQLTLLTTPSSPRPPPKELNKAQVAIWRMVTATLPQEYFGPDTQPLLVAYCRHVHSMNVLAERIDVIENGGEDDDAPGYLALLKARTQESTVLLRLAQAQRLTQHSRYRADAVAVKGSNAQGADKPWQPAASH